MQNTTTIIGFEPGDLTTDHYARVTTYAGHLHIVINRNVTIICDDPAEAAAFFADLACIISEVVDNNHDVPVYVDAWRAHAVPTGG